MITLQQQARALGDPTRHRIFEYVAASPGPVGIAELTAEFAFNHNAIRQHLAKLLAAGLVVETTASSGGRGRPRLQYRVDPGAHSRWGVAGGPYERLAQLLTEVIASGDTPEEVGRRAGKEFEISDQPVAAVSDMARVMAGLGFAPQVQEKGRRVDVVLDACPFASAALTSRDVVCGLHLGLAEGMAAGADGLRVDDLVAKDPRRAGCRLKLRLAGSA